MPSVDRCAVPELPPPLLALLRELDPEARICLERKGGKSYEPLADFSTPPLFEMSARTLATFVQQSVEADGDGYFRVNSSSIKNYSWYAYVAEAGTSAAPDNEALSPGERHVLALLQHTVDSYVRFLNLQPEFSKSTIAVLKQCAKQQRQTNKALRAAAADSSEVMIASLEEQRKTSREAMGFDLFKEWLDKEGKNDTTVQGLVQQLCVRLEPDDFDVLREHEVAGELFKASSPVAFRDAAQATATLFEAGDLPLSETAQVRLAEWLPKVISMMAAKKS